MNLEEKTTSSEIIFNGKLIKLRVDQVLLPNGKKAAREIIRHPGAAAIMPFTKDGKMIFVEQYRKPIEQAILEIPAGKIDPEDKSPKETGIRELEEETGYLAEKIELLTSMYTTPGFTDELIYIYKAEGLKKVSQPKSGDDDEFIKIKILSFDQAWTAYENNKIRDAKTISALLFWKIERMSANKRDEEYES